MSILKTTAVVNGVDNNRYLFQEKDSLVAFSVPMNVIHSRVKFPSSMLNEDGMLKKGVYVYMVKKDSDYNPQLKVMYYPDNTVYQVNNNNKERFDVESVSYYSSMTRIESDNMIFQHNLMHDLLDLTLKTETVFILPKLIEILTKNLKK